ncbi:MAG: hypothetical protein DRO65_03305 [Candidatus Altiarchaeales archaeon]|nr:MAG: hypothetical protein DRO65_03305 [Candidatus Altiarchaeales archaeon]
MDVRIGTIVMVALLLVSASFAFPSLTASEDKIRVTQGEIKKIKITIENEREVPVWYSIYLPGYYSWAIPSVNQIKLAPGEKGSFYLIISPSENILPGEYFVNLIVETKFGREKKAFSVKVVKKEVVLEKARVDKIKGDKKGVEIAYYTPYEKTKEVVMVYKGDSVIFKSERIVSKGTNTFSRELKLDTGEYKVVLELYANGELKLKEEKTFSVLARLIKYSSEWNFILVKGERITFINEKPEKVTVRYNLTIPKIQEPFFHTHYFTEKEARGDFVIYRWEVVLNPGEKYVIEYKIDYLPIFLTAVLLIILFVITYELLMPDVFVRKFALGRKEVGIKEGKGIKICVEVGNRKRGFVSHLQVEDTVPNIFHLGKRFLGGKPKIKRSKNHTKLIWEIPKLEGKEIRVFSYEIVPVIGLSEGIKLPKAEAIFRARGKRLKVSSKEIKV